MTEREKAIAEAKKKAVAAPVTPSNVEWPRWEDVELEDALTMLEIQMWEGAGKFSFGLNQDGKGMWARVSFPKWSIRHELAGKSAITFSSDLLHLLRKLAQLATVHDPSVWKNDPYAR